MAAKKATTTIPIVMSSADRIGAGLTWTNQDEITHTVTSGTPERRDATFDIRLAGKGTTGSVEFTRAGVFPFFCERHPAMRGEIHVN